VRSLLHRVPKLRRPCWFERRGRRLPFRIARGLRSTRDAPVRARRIERRPLRLAPLKERGRAERRVQRHQACADGANSMTGPTGCGLSRDRSRTAALDQSPFGSFDHRKSARSPASRARCLKACSGSPRWALTVVTHRLRPSAGVTADLAGSVARSRRAGQIRLGPPRFGCACCTLARPPPAGPA